MEYPLVNYLCPTAWHRDEMQEFGDEKGRPSKSIDSPGSRAAGKVDSKKDH